MKYVIEPWKPYLTTANCDTIKQAWITVNGKEAGRIIKDSSQYMNGKSITKYKVDLNSQPTARFDTYDECIGYIERILNKGSKPKIPSTYEFFSDPGHGWLKVSKKVLQTLGIADKITSFSYQKGEYAYLEEDCDAGLFVKTYREIYNKEPKLRVSGSNKQSRIRGYNSYRF